MQCRLHLRNVFAAKCKLRQYHALKFKYFSLNQRFHTFPTFKGIWGLWKTNISSTLFNTFPVNSITIWRRIILPRLQAVIVLSFCMLSISRLFQGSTSVYLMCSSCRFDFSSPNLFRFLQVLRDELLLALTTCTGTGMSGLARLLLSASSSPHSKQPLVYVQAYSLGPAACFRPR